MTAATVSFGRAGLRRWRPPAGKGTGPGAVPGQEPTAPAEEFDRSHAGRGDYSFAFFLRFFALPHQLTDFVYFEHFVTMPLVGGLTIFAANSTISLG